MASFTGTAPNQVPTNDNLGRFAYLDYLGIEDTACQTPTIASASSISIATKVSFVSGTTTINTIVVPPNVKNSTQITLIPTGLFLTGISGNIAIATTAVVSKALILTYDATTGKWYPSY
jgi:hypothetical protein